MRILYLSVLSVLLASFTYAQDRRCGQQILENQLRASDPSLDAFIEAHNLRVQQEGYSQSGQRAEKIIIPLVFHVIHFDGPENIGDDQIHSAVRIMNEDFRAINDEIDDVVSAFQNVVGDAEVEFRLASVDPDGQPTNGIDRIKSDQTFIGNDNAKLNPWPRANYYNIWVTDEITVSGTNASAYAYRPAVADGIPGVDGVISNDDYVGDIGTAVSGGSKTLTHETGHYLDLAHTWGETNFPGCDGTASNPNDPCFGVNNCGFDDGISDTPNTLGTDNGGCNLTQTTCSSLDNVQNFMDYASCESMFSQGQVNRMRGALNSPVAERSSLWTSSNLSNTGVSELNEARYYVSKNVACRGESVQFFDESRYDPDSWSWEVSGPVTLTSDDQHPSFTFTEPGVYDVQLTVTQGSETLTITDEGAFAVSDFVGVGVPFSEDFQDGGTKWAIDHRESYTRYQWEFNDDYGYDDESSFMVYNIGNDAKNPDDLILSGIDFRPLDKVEISFKVAFARLNNDDNDELRLWLSNDCGESWKSVWSAGAAELNDGKPLSTSIFRPESQDDWATFSVSNIPSAWVSENTFMRFSFTPGGGNQLYLDNINVGGDFFVVPTLIYPYDGSPSMSESLLLDWNSVPGSDSYEYEVSTVSDFSSKIASGTVDAIGDAPDQSDTEFQVSGLERGLTHYWRVRAKSGSTSSAWSEVWTFTVADDGVGVNELAVELIEVFPNPTNELLNIRINQPLEQLEIQVFNVSGQLVDRQNISSINSTTIFGVPTTTFPEGAYFIRMTSENRTWSYRFIVNH